MSYYSYYGYGHYGPQFLDASNELTGPGSHAYERATSPDGTVRTSYAHEGYDGSTYYHNVIEQNY